MNAYRLPASTLWPSEDRYQFHNGSPPTRPAAVADRSSSMSVDDARTSMVVIDGSRQRRGLQSTTSLVEPASFVTVGRLYLRPVDGGGGETAGGARRSSSAAAFDPWTSPRATLQLLPSPPSTGRTVRSQSIAVVDGNALQSSSGFRGTTMTNGVVGGRASGRDEPPGKFGPTDRTQPVGVRETVRRLSVWPDVGSSSLRTTSTKAMRKYPSLTSLYQTSVDDDRPGRDSRTPWISRYLRQQFSGGGGDDANEERPSQWTSMGKEVGCRGGGVASLVSNFERVLTEQHLCPPQHQQQHQMQQKQQKRRESAACLSSSTAATSGRDFPTATRYASLQNLSLIGDGIGSVGQTQRGHPGEKSGMVTSLSLADSGRNTLQTSFDTSPLLTTTTTTKTMQGTTISGSGGSAGKLQSFGQYRALWEARIGAAAAEENTQRGDGGGYRATTTARSAASMAETPKIPAHSSPTEFGVHAGTENGSGIGIGTATRNDAGRNRQSVISSSELDAVTTSGSGADNVSVASFVIGDVGAKRRRPSEDSGISLSTYDGRQSIETPPIRVGSASAIGATAAGWSGPEETSSVMGAGRGGPPADIDDTDSCSIGRSSSIRSFRSMSPGQSLSGSFRISRDADLAKTRFDDFDDATQPLPKITIRRLGYWPRSTDPVTSYPPDEVNSDDVTASDGVPQWHRKSAERSTVADSGSMPPSTTSTSHLSAETDRIDGHTKDAAREASSVDDELPVVAVDSRRLKAGSAFADVRCGQKPDVDVTSSPSVVSSPCAASRRSVMTLLTGGDGGGDDDGDHRLEASGGGRLEVELEKGAATGIGFCVEGGKGSLDGDRPIAVKRLFKSNGSIQGKLKVGDEILSADGKDFTGLSHYEAWNHLKAIPDGVFTMIINRK